MDRARQRHSPGQMLGGRYRIAGALGRGGSAEVYLAQDSAMDRRVVIKTLLGHVVHDALSRARFEREARSLARFSHPNIVGVHDFGVTAEGEPFLVLEHVDGQTLQSYLRLAAGPLRTAVALTIADQVLNGLVAAHGENIVHRDLKPSNIMLTRKAGDLELVKVLDFGVAKLLSPIAAAADETGPPTEQALTNPGSAVGTPLYMAPEQVARGSSDARSDIYALGCILYEMLAGQHPVEGKTTREVLLSHLSGALVPLRTRAPDLSAEVAALVDRALAVEPEQRFQSAVEMQGAVRSLLQVLAGAGRISLDLPPDVDVLARTDPGLLPATREEPLMDVPGRVMPALQAPTSRWSSLRLMGIVALAFVLGGVVGVAVWPRPSAEQPRAITPGTPGITRAMPGTGSAAPVVDPKPPCEEGRVRVAESEEACCWEGQQWDDERRLCAGPPERCPARHIATTTECIPVAPQDWPTVASCVQGNGGVCYDLAQPYLDDNPMVALGFYRLGCDAGNHEVCFFLGNMDLDISPDEGRVERALTAWNRACDGNVERACMALAEAYAEGDPPISADPVQAARYYGRLCENFDHYCREAAAYFLESGPLEPNPVRARRLLAHGCDTGCRACCEGVGTLDATGPPPSD